ncbi:MAG: hypothetical protein GY930_10420 [bacterium]|nr:hypothetical protein [bacterium]
MAQFTHAAPTQVEYTLHGTLPIPSGTWDGDRQHPTLTVRNYDGSLAPTQMEVVTRSSTGDPEVVELIARVQRDPATAPGTQIDFEVVLHAGTPAPIQVESEIQQLIRLPEQIVMRTADVYGNEYEADLLADLHTGLGRVLKSGSQLMQLGSHEMLLPSAGSDPATCLPHMMGLQVYTTVFSGGSAIALDLIVHNAMTGLDEETETDDLMDDLYFFNLRMEIPQGWVLLSAFENPHETGLVNLPGGNRAEMQIVNALPNGKLHLLPRQARFTRRFYLARETAEGLEQARALKTKAHMALLKRPRTQSQRSGQWSWWNPTTSFYYPQKFPLPVLSDFDLGIIEGQLQSRFDRVVQQTSSGGTGLYPFVTAAMGWCHPWGIPYGGATGGDEINFVDGLKTAVTESITGYRLAEISAKAYMDRQPVGFYGLDGAPLRSRDLLQLDPQSRFYISAHFQLSPSGIHDFPRFDLAPKNHIQTVLSQGLQPDYETDLRGWDHVDIQHLIRYTRNYKTLIWLGNDALAKDEMRLIAELYRLSYPEVRASAWNHVQGTGMLFDQNYVLNNPQQGVGVGRGEAWGMDACCTAYAVSGSDFRTRFRPWFQLFADVIRDGQSACTGNLVSFYISNYFGGQYRVRQSFEVAMVEQSLRSIGECVFKNLPGSTYVELRNAQIGSTYSSVNAPVWDETMGGPLFRVGVGSSQGGPSDFCQSTPPGATSNFVDHTDYWNAIAYTQAVAPDPLLLTRIQRMIDMATTVQGVSPLHGTNRIEARAAMLYLLETPLP